MNHIFLTILLFNTTIFSASALLEPEDNTVSCLTDDFFQSHSFKSFFQFKKPDEPDIEATLRALRVCNVVVSPDVDPNQPFSDKVKNVLMRSGLQPHFSAALKSQFDALQGIGDSTRDPEEEKTIVTAFYFLKGQIERITIEEKKLKQEQTAIRIKRNIDKAQTQKSIFDAIQPLKDIFFTLKEMD